MPPPQIRTPFVKVHTFRASALPALRGYAFRNLALFCACFLFLPLQTADAQTQFIQCGKASWYALTSMTASGERANPNAMAAAHRTLPFGTLVKVSNLRNGKEITVRINDRGPFVKGRVIDVTKAAASELGFLPQGVAKVRITVAGADGKTHEVQDCGE
ncbi:septal ring lytic transglycosylase RlpA family protein [uncultured Roseibium sp.]|uniref:septal ring lytic transglycosylase RlpA family protein n=1 Tax=uncultured Roseibium sp. TaxID=1936171 RepID=UPI003216433F